MNKLFLIATILLLATNFQTAYSQCNGEYCYSCKAFNDCERSEGNCNYKDYDCAPCWLYDCTGNCTQYQKCEEDGGRCTGADYGCKK